MESETDEDTPNMLSMVAIKAVEIPWHSRTDLLEVRPPNGKKSTVSLQCQGAYGEQGKPVIATPILFVPLELPVDRVRWQQGAHNPTFAATC